MVTYISHPGPSLTYPNGLQLEGACEADCSSDLSNVRMGKHTLPPRYEQTGTGYWFSWIDICNNPWLMLIGTHNCSSMSGHLTFILILIDDMIELNVEC